MKSSARSEVLRLHAPYTNRHIECNLSSLLLEHIDRGRDSLTIHQYEKSREAQTIFSPPTWFLGVVVKKYPVIGNLVGLSGMQI